MVCALCVANFGNIFLFLNISFAQARYAMSVSDFFEKTGYPS